MNIPRITHIALHVSDLPACISFYKKYCGMDIVHRREAGTQQIVWMAEPKRDHEFVFVMMSGGSDLQLSGSNYCHFGFALDSCAAVDRIAKLAEDDGCLIWQPRQEGFPVGYYCGLCDPNGNHVEFSYGQPLGEELTPR